MNQNITLLFFAQLREALQCEKLILPIQPELTVSELTALLKNKNEHWHKHLNEDIQIAVNQKIAKATDVLNANDEVAFFPPVTGG